MAKATTRKPPPRRSAAPNLSDRDFEELVGLMKGADSIELKLTVPAPDHGQAVTALGMDPLDAQIRQVFFFDTPDLALYKQGVVVRARRVQRKGDDSVVKLRPVVPNELPADLRASRAFGVEVDAMPGGFVCSGSMKHALGTKDVREAARGEASPAQAVFEGAAGAVRRARARRDRPGRSVRPGADLRPQAEAFAQGARPQARCGDVALSRQLTDPRAVDEVRAVGRARCCR